MITLILVIIFLIIFDRLFKFLVINFSGSSVRALGDIFKINFAENYNIAFSLPLGGLTLNIFICFIVLSLVYYFIYLVNKKRLEAAIFLLAVILGATSNLLDRLKYGYVIDYFDLKHFTVFNLADVMIVGGMAGLLWFLRGLDVKKEM